MRKINYKTIDEYIAIFPADIQERLKKIREIIRENVPQETIESISYQIPTFKHNGKYVIYFAGFKNHTSVYPIPTGDKKFQKEISPFVKGKGTLQFKNSEDLPIALIRKVTKLSVEENLNRTKSY